jgi:hypothetical protein
MCKQSACHVAEASSGLFRCAGVKELRLRRGRARFFLRLPHARLAFGAAPALHPTDEGLRGTFLGGR